MNSEDIKSLCIFFIPLIFLIIFLIIVDNQKRKKKQEFNEELERLRSGDWGRQHCCDFNDANKNKAKNVDLCNIPYLGYFIKFIANAGLLLLICVFLGVPALLILGFIGSVIGLSIHDGILKGLGVLAAVCCPLLFGLLVGSFNNHILVNLQRLVRRLVCLAISAFSLYALFNIDKLEPNLEGDDVIIYHAACLLLFVLTGTFTVCGLVGDFKLIRDKILSKMPKDIAMQQGDSAGGNGVDCNKDFRPGWFAFCVVIAVFYLLCEVAVLGICIAVFSPMDYFGLSELGKGFVGFLQFVLLIGIFVLVLSDVSKKHIYVRGIQHLSRIICISVLLSSGCSMIYRFLFIISTHSRNKFIINEYTMKCFCWVFFILLGLVYIREIVVLMTDINKHKAEGKRRLDAVVRGFSKVFSKVLP